MTGVLVLVTGPPASGKTTLAVPLAATLGLPLIGKDLIKEALFDALGTGDRAWSRRLGRTSYEVLYAVAGALPAAVLDANLGPEAIPRLHALDAHLIEVFCRCPAAEVERRFASRAPHPPPRPRRPPPRPRDQGDPHPRDRPAAPWPGPGGRHQPPGRHPQGRGLGPGPPPPTGSAATRLGRGPTQGGLHRPGSGRSPPRREAGPNAIPRAPGCPQPPSWAVRTPEGGSLRGQDPGEGPV
jgi:predicted kinase